MESLKSIFKILVLVNYIQLAISGSFFVRNANIAALNSTALIVSWDPDPFGTAPINYEIQIESIGMPPRNSLVTITFESINNTNQLIEIIGLFPYTMYQVTISGTDNLTTEFDDTVLEQRTTEDVSGAPFLLSFTVVNATTVQVQWGPPIEIVQNGPITSFLINFANDIIPAYNRSFNVNGIYPISIIINFESEFTVEEGINYTITVSAVNGAGVGNASNSEMVSVPEAAPPNIEPFLPTQIMVIQQTPTDSTLQLPPVTIPFLNGVLVGFGVVHAGFLSGEALFGDNQLTFFDQLPNVTFTASENLTLILENLLPNYRYTVSINAQSDLGATQFTTLLLSSQPAAVPSGPPVNISLQADSSDRINVSWSVNIRTVNGLLLAFSINYSVTNMAGSNVVSYFVGKGDIGPYETQLSGLSANTYYDVRISIVNNIGQGVISSPLITKTFPLNIVSSSVEDECLTCYLVPLGAFVAITILVLVIVITLISYFIWDKLNKQKASYPVEMELTAQKGKLVAKDSLVYANPDAENPYTIN